jgi:proteic killer suppression protein
MIASFGDQTTEDIFHGEHTKAARRIPVNVHAAAFRKLVMVNEARAVMDLRAPPGNRLEGLRGDLAGYYSIRINDQWRVVFRWEGAHAYEVRITDYH